MAQKSRGVSAHAYDKSAEQVLDALRRRGTSARRWALVRGYRVRTVYAAIGRWAHRPDRPLGGINRQILADLRAELGDDFPVAANASTDPAGTPGTTPQRTPR